jgi:hypothetical protein
MNTLKSFALLVSIAASSAGCQLIVDFNRALIDGGTVDGAFSDAGDAAVDAGVDVLAIPDAVSDVRYVDGTGATDTGAHDATVDGKADATVDGAGGDANTDGHTDAGAGDAKADAPAADAHTDAASDAGSKSDAVSDASDAG